MHNINKYSEYIFWELFQADYKQKCIYSVLVLCFPCMLSWFHLARSHSLTPLCPVGWGRESGKR